MTFPGSTNPTHVSGFSSGSNFQNSGACNPPKYVVIDGVTRINPEHQRLHHAHTPSSTALNPQQALVVISNIDQFDELKNNVGAGNPELCLSAATLASLEIMQQSDVCDNVGITTDSILKELGKIFAKHEAPVGLMNKLMILSEFDELQFIVDDSGSMSTISDTRDSFGRLQTRWEEAKNRLKEILEILAYVPTPKIVIRFLNRQQVVTLEHKGEAPDRFIDTAYRQIETAFRSNPYGGTPALECLQQSFRYGAGRRIARYFFCDGEPNGGEYAKNAIADLVKNRPNPQQNPLTFLSCTSNDEEAEWMKDLEELAPYCAEYDDFRSEALEVKRDQGNVLPFTKGFYLIGQIVAAMNPDDLDAMDESVPLTKWTLDNLLGVVGSEQEYRQYFNGFKEAQRTRVRSSASDVIKAQFQWEQYYYDFLKQHVARNIDGVRHFKNQLMQPESFATSLFHSWW